MFKPTRALPLMLFLAASSLSALLELISSNQIYSSLKSEVFSDSGVQKTLTYWVSVSDPTLDFQSLINVSTVILLIVWLHRVVANARSLDEEHFKTKPSAAIWGSLILVLNFFFPFYLLRKAWISAEPDKKIRVTLLIVALWTACFFEVFVRALWGVSSFTYNDAGVADRHKLALVYAGDYFTQFCVLVAISLILIVVSKVNRAQSRKALAAGLTSVPLKTDLVTFSGLASVLLAQICMPLLGLIATIMIYGFIWRQFGLLGSIAAVVFVPFTVTLVPWYAGFAKQDWSLVFVSYVAGIVLFLLLLLGVWLTDAND